MSEGIRISIGIAAPPRAVWEALTVPERFKQWFSSCRDMQIDPTPGGKAVFTGGGDDAAYRSEGVILDCIEDRKLFHTVLEGHDPAWYGSLLWSIEPSGEHSRLTLAESGFQGREEEISDIEEGWRALLLSLCRTLEKSDVVQLPEEYHNTASQSSASAFGYSYADKPACWERIMALHGGPALDVLKPISLRGDLAPGRPGTLLDALETRKLMYTWPEDGWEAVASWLLDDMGSETKISLQLWGYEHRPDALARAQKTCDEIMDRLVAGLDAQRKGH